ncbi:MAG: hypothetical protein DRN53_01990, partial [Thermoprotei archaeon]
MDECVLLILDPLDIHGLNSRLTELLREKYSRITVLEYTFNKDLFKHFLSLLDVAENKSSEVYSVVGLGYGAPIALRVSLQRRLRKLVLIGYRSILISLLFDDDFRSRLKVNRGDILLLLEEYENELMRLEPIFFFKRCPLAKEVILVRLEGEDEIGELEFNNMRSLFRRYCRRIQPRIVNIDISEFYRINEFI